MGNDTFEYLFLHLISNNTQSTNCFLSIRLFMARNLRVALYYSDSTTETVNWYSNPFNKKVSLLNSIYWVENWSILKKLFPHNKVIKKCYSFKLFLRQGEAIAEVKEEEPGKPDKPGGGGTSTLTIVSVVGSILLILNLVLLYFYCKRRAAKHLFGKSVYYF